MHDERVRGSEKQGDRRDGRQPRDFGSILDGTVLASRLTDVASPTVHGRKDFQALPCDLLARRSARGLFCRRVWCPGRGQVLRGFNKSVTPRRSADYLFERASALRRACRSCSSTHAPWSMLARPAFVLSDASGPVVCVADLARSPAETGIGGRESPRTRVTPAGDFLSASMLCCADASCVDCGQSGTGPHTSPTASKNISGNYLLG